jgi:hypothetical protein
LLNCYTVGRKPTANSTGRHHCSCPG